jgi:uncharacterized protein (TIGR03437 family)
MLKNRLYSVRVSAILCVFAAIFLLESVALAQQPVCTPNATAAAVHLEGLAERVGNITLTCVGGTANSTVSLSLFISLNTNITNRLDSNGDPLGIVQTGGTVASLRSTSATTISFSALNYTVPATPSTPVTITISGIRAAVAPLAAGTRAAVVSASVLGVGATFPQGVSLIVATATPTLLASTVNNGVPCNGSALPGSLDFNGFAAVSNSSSVRITEASATSFSSTDPGADSGLRFRLNLTGYGSATRVFVPDLIAGNDAAAPTASGAFGVTAAAGTYTPGAGQLLLIRVSGATSGGAGGALVSSKPNVATALGAIAEIQLTGGAATVVYEVVDGSASLVESAQLPVFVVAAPTSCPSSLAPQLTVNAAPVSSVTTASATEAVPRFLLSAPPLDCQGVGDCGAGYYPRLFADRATIALTGSSLGGLQSTQLRVANSGAGVLNYTATIAYQSGSGWLSVTPPSGTTATTALTNLQVVADPSSLSQGTYTATVTIDGGLYGSATIPVTFSVGPVGVVVTNVGNAASFQYGTVAPGSYAVVFGLNMAGTNVGVTFNNLPATIVFKNATQINLLVPAALGTQQAASVVVTVDGRVSDPFRVNLLLNSPGIFTPGIINFTDGAVNDAGHPAARGDFVLVFFTGLFVPLTGPVTVNIGSQMNLTPSFAGAQGTLAALDQVNITIPTALAAGTSPVPIQVCIPGALGTPVCSNQVNLFIK